MGIIFKKPLLVRQLPELEILGGVLKFQISIFEQRLTNFFSFFTGMCLIKTVPIACKYTRIGITDPPTLRCRITMCYQ
jgi:hypothetical protein